MALKAKQSFAVGRRVIRKGDVVADDDPAVKGREALFTTELVAPVEPVVERATAAPGEKRVTPKRTKTASKKTK